MRSQRYVIHTAPEVEGIRQAASDAAGVRDQLASLIRPGMTTAELDRLAGDLIRQTGGRSAFLDYRGFPGQICVSINSEVVHGIGRLDRVIAPADVVSIDVGTRRGGYVGDTATTVVAGGVEAEPVQRLLVATRRGLEAGIAAATCGNYVNDIGRAVEAVIDKAGFSVVRDFVGHGCGCELHEPPEVPNFAQERTRGPRLRPGMVLAIEPMVNAGTHRVTIDADGWTVRTADDQMSAHFEHMVLITTGRPEILTWRKIA